MTSLAPICSPIAPIALNSNGNPFVDFGLLIDTYSSNDLNFAKKGFISTIFICNPKACRPSYVYYCCCYKCCCNCWKCCELPMVSIQFSYTSPSKCRCFSLFRNLVSCSFLTSCLYSLNCPSYKDVIYGTFVVCLATYTIVGITCTIVGITNGSILPLVIFYAFAYVLSCFLFTLESKALPSSTFLFLLRALICEFVVTFFLFSSVVYIFSLVFLTLVDGFYGFSF